MQSLNRRTWPFSFLVLIPTLTGCSSSQDHGNGPSPGEPPGPEVTVRAVISAPITDYEDFPGHLEAVNAIDIRCRVTGFLTKFNFKEGSFVKKGDVLFEIDDRPYKAELDRTEGAVLQMEGRLTRLETELKRAKTLLKQNTISPEEHDRVLSDRIEALGNLKIAKANRETAALKVGWTKVEAPISGRVGRRFIDPGNLVKEDDTILTTIVDLDPIYAYFDVDERTTLRFQKLIREGWSKDAKLPVYMGLASEEKDKQGAYPGFPRTGWIHFADNKVDADTGTWRLRGLFANNDYSLTPGLFVRVRLPIGAPHKAKLIPEQALGSDQGQKFVYVVDDKNEVHYRHVEPGRLHRGLRVIEDPRQQTRQGEARKSGLELGEKVIVSGLQRARPGNKVTPLMQLEAVVVKVDNHANAISLRVKDEQGRPTERTYKLTKDVRMVDDAGRVIESASLTPGTLVVITEHQGQLREIIQESENEGKEPNSTGDKEPKR